jgi:hypothetical protein
VADGLVSRQAKASENILCRANDAFFFSVVQGGSVMLCVPSSLSNRARPLGQGSAKAPASANKTAIFTWERSVEIGSEDASVLPFFRVLRNNKQVTPYIRIVFLALLLAPCFASSQSFVVNGPFAPDHYKPLTAPERWQRWVSEDGGSASIHVQSFASAAYLQAIADPTAWSRTTGGFIRRTGSSYGGNLIQNSVHESLAGVAGTDPRYLACACPGFFHRSGHALEMTFLTYTHGGHKTLDLPQLAGVYGGSMIEATWWPHHYSARVQGVQTGHIQVGLTGAIHLVQEFSPELRRMVHLKTAAASTTP